MLYRKILCAFVGQSEFKVAVLMKLIDALFSHKDLDKAKRSKRVKYWIQYRCLKEGKIMQRKEPVNNMEGLDGYSIEDAKAAHAKQVVQKKEKPGLNIPPEYKMTFNKLTEWYLKLEKIKNRKSFWLIKLRISNFNDEFGNRIISSVKKSEIDNFQEKLLKEGKAPATVDHVISKTRAMVNKAIGDDLISRDAVKAFKVKNTLKKGSDVRDRILSPVEFQSLMENAAEHLRPIVACGYHTGMRKGEILGLTWDKVDLANRMIHLEAKDTKDTEARNIPICDELHQHLVPMPNRVQGTGQDSHVFQYNGKPVKNIAKALKKACEKAKIKYGRFVKDGFVFYDLRHTFNTYMRKAGVQESVIMSITGHSTREMFDRYNAVDEDDKQEAMEQLGYFLTKDSPEVAKQIDDFLTKNPKEAAKHIKEFLAKGPKKAVKSLRVYLANVTQMVTQIKNTEKKTSRKVPTDNNS